MFVKYLAGPLIGAVIGYFTNFIAVKMLFYPRQEVKVLGHKVPFTPGAIPKGKNRLAKAIGGVVGNTLITKEDIEKKLLSDDVGLEIADALTSYVSTPIKESITELTHVSNESYMEKRDKLSIYISETIVDSVTRMDISDIIVEKGSAIIKEKLNNPMLSMFITDELLASILRPMSTELQSMIATNGLEYVKPMVDEKLVGMESSSVIDVLGNMDIEEDTVKKVIASMCMKMMQNGIEQVMNTLNIQEIVEEKINEMSVDELETLVMTVMKKELNTIVNLGAFIGLLLGLLNLLF